MWGAGTGVGAVDEFGSKGLWQKLPNEPIFDPNPNKIQPLVPFRNEPILDWLAGRCAAWDYPSALSICMKEGFDSEIVGGKWWGRKEIFLAEFVTRCRAAIKKSNPPHRNFRLGAAKVTGDNRLDSPVRSRSHDETPSQALCACTLFHARDLVGAGNPGSPGQNGGPRNRHQIRAKRRR